jgi:ParB/RepB/Spo0J family partition protein
MRKTTRQQPSGLGMATSPSALERLAIIHMPIDSIIPNPSNPRKHSPQQLRAIARSIEKFGFATPIGVDRENKIIFGHGRLEAARLCGHKDVPVVRLKHLTEEQAKALMLADNKLTEGSRWDERQLAVVLNDLKIELNFEIEVPGFEPPEIDRLLRTLDPPDELMEAADEFEVAEGQPISRLGDSWSLGRHRLFCGNALESTSYDALLTGEEAAAIFTDPPYNVPVNGHVTGKGRRKHREFAMAAGEMTREAFTRFLRDALRMAVSHSVENATLFACMDWRHVVEIAGAIREIGCQLLNLCVWVKTNGGMGSLYRSQHELVFAFCREGAARTNNVQLGKFGRNRTNVWNYPGMNSFPPRGRTRGLDYHPTVKPIAMVADAILDVTPRGGIVLDPFSGSGTTILAAEKTGRRGYGMDLDPRYVDTTIERWQRMTGQAAVHASGKTFEEIRAERSTKILECVS